MLYRFTLHINKCHDTKATQSTLNFKSLGKKITFSFFFSFKALCFYFILDETKYGRRLVQGTP